MAASCNAFDDIASAEQHSFRSNTTRSNKDAQQVETPPGRALAWKEHVLGSNYASGDIAPGWEHFPLQKFLLPPGCSHGAPTEMPVPSSGKLATANVSRRSVSWIASHDFCSCCNTKDNRRQRENERSVCSRTANCAQ